MKNELLIVIRLPALLFLLMLFNTGCVYELQTVELFDGHYVDIEPKIEGSATITNVTAASNEKEFNLHLTYKDYCPIDLKSNSNYRADFLVNNCLFLKIRPFRGVDENQSQAIDRRISILKKINYHGFRVYFTFKDGIEKPDINILVNTSFDIFSRSWDPETESYNKLTIEKIGYRTIVMENEILDYKFSTNSTISNNESFISRNENPIKFTQRTLKYEYDNSITKRILLTPLALAFDVLSLPVLFILVVS